MAKTYSVQETELERKLVVFYNICWIYNLWLFLQKTPMIVVEEEEEEIADIQPDPLHQLILHFSHNALTERRWDIHTPANA